MTKNMSVLLSFLQGLASCSPGWEAVISLVVAPSFSADRSPATPTGLAKRHVWGGTCHQEAPAPLLACEREVLREGD